LRRKAKGDLVRTQADLPDGPRREIAIVNGRANILERERKGEASECLNEK
jgi:hypothetical protein